MNTTKTAAIPRLLRERLAPMYVKICNSQDGNESAEDKPNGDECICTVLCTESTVNANCPVCGAADADLSVCKGEKPVDSVEEVQARIDDLLDKAQQEGISEEDKAAVAAEYKSILEAIDALSDEEKN